MKRSTFLAFLILVMAPALVSAIPLDLTVHEGKNPVIVIFARARDEPRMFSFNLALSTDWNRIEARNIVTVDVGPDRYDLDQVAQQLGVNGAEFAIVVISRDGEVIHRTEDPDALPRILMIIDQERHRDNSSLSG
ncbi:MAG: hypothetical protein PF508_05605 [Spirochaeta sp.]|jgi:hypothetical protein|nr:hypothetical protein [Spirochaeta sp.]